MRGKLAALIGAAALGATALTGCGSSNTTAADTAPPVATASATVDQQDAELDEWTDNAVAEILAEYGRDIAQHCLAVVGYETGRRAKVPSNASFVKMSEAVDGIISIARANPARMVDTSSGVLRIDDWMLMTAGWASCDEPAAARLTHTAETLGE